MKSFEEIIAPIAEMRWKLCHIFAPNIFPKEKPRATWDVQIWSNDYSRFAQGDGPTLEIAVARAVVKAKSERKPLEPPAKINLDDLELDL